MSFLATDSTTGRQLEATVDPLFVQRWSRRAFRDEEVTPDQLASVFEAARWAASCFNDQPWLFRYATRSGGAHEAAAGVLMEGNRVWAESAPVIGVVFARRALTKTGAPNAWGRFDAGAASAQFALQASMLGLSVHFMGGFEPEASYEVFGVDSEEWDAVAAFALGHPLEADTLPEALAEREAPSPRKPLTEVAQEVQA